MYGIMDIQKPTFTHIISKASRSSSPGLPELRSVRNRYLAEVERFLTDPRAWQAAHP